jgi:hypothetical protein
MSIPMKLTAHPRLLARLTTRAGRLAVLPTLLLLSGCQLFGYIAKPFEGEPAKTEYSARYTDLADRRVTVLVAASDAVRYRFPRAVPLVTEAVTQNLSANVEGLALTDPAATLEYEKQNPYWATFPPSRLLGQFQTDRLIILDLSEYRVHEPGNVNLWQGRIEASVSVYAIEAEDSDNSVFNARVSGGFPENTTTGLPKGDADTIQLGMIANFARQAARLFHDYKE